MRRAVVNQGRILPLVGPAVVLYLIAEVIGAARALDVTAVAFCGLALGLAAVPFWGLRADHPPSTARRVAILGALAGVALVRWARPDAPSLYLDLAASLAVPALGALCLRLALDTPDEPSALARRRRPVSLASILIAVPAALGAALSVAPVIELFGQTWIVPHRWAWAAPAAAAGMLVVAAALRVARRRLRSPPEALAAGGWALLGILAALAGGVGVAVIVASDALPLGSAPVRGLAALAALSIVSGHVAMIGARRQVRAGPHTRRLLAGALAVGAVGAIFAMLGPHVPREPVAIGVAAGLGVVLGALLYAAASALAARALAPFGGRLVMGAREALNAAVGATSLEELGEAVLPPLRRASNDLEAAPLILCLAPPRVVRVDAAGVAHVEAREPSPALCERMREKPGEVVVAAPLLEQVVRRAELRPLAEALSALDALAVVPLAVDLELEGALVVPRGARRGALTLEEIDALEQLGRHLCAQVAMLSAQERARQRTRDAVLRSERLEEALEAAREELDRARADARMLKAGGAPRRASEPAIAYSPSMRRLTRRVEQLGPIDAPVLLIGEEGSGLDRVGQFVHAAGGRRDGPFVVAECAAVRPELVEAALFGDDEGQPGWLRLASGGTCLLCDVPALPLSAQVKLAEALATRRATLADGTGGYPIDARVIATSRVALAPLVDAGAFDAELHRRFAPLTLEVPALRDRVEDLPSLVLLALDRSCRVTGRPVVGIEPEAQARLARHTWPGNLPELESVIARAVAATKGSKVGVEELPPLAPARPVDPWSGTYVELERRILVRALERADGNKTVAARQLGLKRTTFLDKLKRHGLAAASAQPDA